MSDNNDVDYGEKNLQAMKSFGAKLTAPLPKTTEQYGAENAAALANAATAVGNAVSGVATAVGTAVTGAATTVAEVGRRLTEPLPEKIMAQKT